MVAGRELNALVAEEIFESPEVVPYIPTKSGPELMAYHRGELMSGDGIWRQGDQSSTDSSWVPKPFSTDISAAWEVWEKLIEDGWYPDLITTYSHATQGQRYTCQMHHADIQDAPHHAVADTAPHAICLAALKAVGALPPEDEEA